LAYKYHDDPWQALRVNTNLGGDNVHRGIVLGTILGIQTGSVAANWFTQLTDHEVIAQEIDVLLAASVKAAAVNEASVPKS
jgi:ADP-ribosylglycohydrolase